MNGKDVTPFYECGQQQWLDVQGECLFAVHGVVLFKGIKSDADLN